MLVESARIRDLDRQVLTIAHWILDQAMSSVTSVSACSTATMVSRRGGAVHCCLECPATRVLANSPGGSRLAHGCAPADLASEAMSLIRRTVEVISSTNSLRSLDSSGVVGSSKPR